MGYTLKSESHKIQKHCAVCTVCYVPRYKQAIPLKRTCKTTKTILLRNTYLVCTTYYFSLIFSLRRVHANHTNYWMPVS